MRKSFLLFLPLLLFCHLFICDDEVILLLSLWFIFQYFHSEAWGPAVKDIYLSKIEREKKKEKKKAIVFFILLILFNVS